VTAADLLLAFLIMLAGAAIQGAVGFGANLFAAPLLALVNPDLVPGPVIASALVVNVLVLRRDRVEDPWPQLRTANAGQIIGAISGAALLAALPTDALAIVFAIVILVGVGLSMSGLHPKRTPTTMGIAGAASGFMGTTTGVGGPPIALVMQKSEGIELRGLLSRFFLVGSVFSLIALFAVGRFGWHELWYGILLVPGVLVGVRGSTWLAARVDRGHLRTAVLALSAASAVATLAKALL